MLACALPEPEYRIAAMKIVGWMGTQKQRTPQRVKLARRVLQLTISMAVLIAALVFTVPDSAAKGSFTVTPPPSWIETITLPPSDAADSAATAAYLLLDHQIRVSANAV